MRIQTKRSPRRVDVDHAALAPIPRNDEAPPPEGSFAWKLWLECRDLAEDALATDYIQGIANGTLDPNVYGQYMLQDAVYSHYGQDDYRVLEQRAAAEGEQEMAAFARARYEGYARYTAETFEAWHIRSVDAVALSQPEQVYVDLEHHVATARSPIFGLIAMIPCDQLWAWLATELRDQAGPGNLYSFWIRENADWGGSLPARQLRGRLGRRAFRRL